MEILPKPRVPRCVGHDVKVAKLHVEFPGARVRLGKYCVADMRRPGGAWAGLPGGSIDDSERGECNGGFKGAGVASGGNCVVRHGVRISGVGSM